jgi:hypothetical protein
MVRERFIIKCRLMAVDNDASRAKLLEFVEALRHECENELLYEVWQSCGASTSGIYTN